jgi:hypothetical protein
LSITIPLAPPVTAVVAEVAVDVDKGLSIRKDMTQPLLLDGQFIVPFVTGLPATLKNIRSVFVLVLLNSVIGEQPTLAVVIAGP